MKFRPLSDRVVVRRVKEEEKTSGGIIIPDTAQEKPQEGEIIAHLASDEAFEGYWRRPDANAKALRENWYFTGDTGYFDRDGDLFVTGRVDDMIISAGENIFPEEIEDALVRCSLVAGVAVVGMPDERLGARVVAFVEPARPGVQPVELEEACLRSGLARFKRPREYVLVKAIPRSASGKLLRRKLRIGEYERLEEVSME